MFLISYLQGSLPPGLHILATAYLHYDSSPGTTLFFSDDVPNPWTFLNYVYGDPSTRDYADLHIGVPTIRMTTGIAFPNMVVTPDTLYYQHILGDPNPDPQYIYIHSDGADFQWNASVPFNYQHTGLAGVSGDSLGVYPRASSMAIGTYDHQVELYSTSAANSPVIVHLHLEVRPPFPSFDANVRSFFVIIPRCTKYSPSEISSSNCLRTASALSSCPAEIYTSLSILLALFSIVTLVSGC